MSKNSDIALIDSQSNESIQWSDKSLHIESTEDLKAFYSDSELANITRPVRQLIICKYYTHIMA